MNATDAEKELLHMLTQHYRFTMTASSEPNATTAASDLIDVDSCSAYIERIGSYLGSPSRVFTASQLAKRYAYLVLVPALVAFSRGNRILDVSLGNVNIESSMEDKYWLPQLRLTAARFLPVGTTTASREVSWEKRNPYRDKLLRLLFADHLALVWRALAKATGISRAVLWENAAVYVYWLYEHGLVHDADPTHQQQIVDDYHYLLQAAPQLFGEQHNPLQKYHGKPVFVPNREEPVRVRKTCCLYYQVAGDGEICQNCPRKYRIR